MIESKEIPATPGVSRRPSGSWSRRTRSNPVASSCSSSRLFLGLVLCQRAADILGTRGDDLFHELGHFVTSKWTGMKATEFFLGFGRPCGHFDEARPVRLKLIPPART